MGTLTPPLPASCISGMRIGNVEFAKFLKPLIILLYRLFTHVLSGCFLRTTGFMAARAAVISDWPDFQPALVRVCCFHGHQGGCFVMRNHTQTVGNACCAGFILCDAAYIPAELETRPYFFWIRWKTRQYRKFARRVRMN